LLHLVGSSVLLYLIDDARSNKNQEHSLNCYDVNVIKTLTNRTAHTF